MKEATPITFKPNQTITAVDQVFSEISALVLREDVDPGAELPPEEVMAMQLKVSKVTLRQALRLAQAQGLIEIRNGQRARVAKPSLKPLINIMDITLRRMGKKDFEDLVKVREILEVNIARDAARLAKKEHIQAMEKTIVEMEQNKEDLAFCVKKDIEFHSFLRKATANRIFDIVLAPIAQILADSMETTLESGGIHAATEAHRWILDAVKQKDPDKAEAAMRKHMVRVRRYAKIKTKNSC
jgi:GntR family transcriptional repressor for pyruvate dehydrogenase complex